MGGVRHYPEICQGKIPREAATRSWLGTVAEPARDDGGIQESSGSRRRPAEDEAAVQAGGEAGASESPASRLSSRQDGGGEEETAYSTAVSLHFKRMIFPFSIGSLGPAAPGKYFISLDGTPYQPAPAADWLLWPNLSESSAGETDAESELDESPTKTVKFSSPASRSGVSMIRRPAAAAAVERGSA